MTPKNLFNIIFKVFGFFILKDFIELFIQFAGTLIFMNKNGSVQEFSTGLFIALAQIILYALIFFLFIFKTNYLIKILKLTRDFDQEMFSIHISASWILEISLIVIAGVILIEEIPNTFRQIYFLVSQKEHAHDFYPGIIVSAVEIIIALLLIGERKSIVGFMEKKNEVKQ